MRRWWPFRGVRRRLSAVDRHEHVELALFSPHFSDVDVEEADRIALELFLRRSVAFDVRQSTNTMAKAAGQMRDGRLQRIEAIVERQ